jgi:hypothetical protein
VDSLRLSSVKILRLAESNQFKTKLFLAADLGISKSLKPLLEKHISFFANKDRTKKFYDLVVCNT